MGKRVLLVDDDELILISVGELFRSGDLAVTTAASAEEALQCAAAEPFDAVVLDVVMPQMSGLEVCRRLRALPGYEHIPIILLTAKSSPRDREQGLAAGADRFLPKPFAPGELLAVVQEALQLSG